MTTIIFGPTGHVGSSAARAALRQNTKVILAMRDTAKPIHPDLENSEKVYADLTKPSTIHDAVTNTGAKHAFIYLVFGNSDHMRSSIEALKEAGIEFVVFLSSEGIQSDVKNVAASDFISYAHAQVEINLSEVFGEKGYVAVRPAWFASNSVQWNPMFRGGEVKVLHPEAKWDWISPADIGRVCGTIAAGVLQATGGKNVVHLNGPQLLSQRDAVAVIARALGKEVKVLEIDEVAYVEQMTNGSGLPEPVAKHLAKVLSNRGAGTDGMYVGQVYEEAVNNISKYGGRKAETFEEWVAENKQDFEV